MDCTTCSNKIHPAHYDKYSCINCLKKYNNPNKVYQYHPNNKINKFMLKCKCGREWNQNCAQLALHTNTYKTDLERVFKDAKTPEERRRLSTDPRYQIKVDNEKHGRVILR